MRIDVPDRVEISHTPYGVLIKDGVSYVNIEVYSKKTIDNYFKLILEILDIKDIPPIDEVYYYSDTQIAELKRKIGLKAIISDIENDNTKNDTEQQF